jgi:hypothetical protein
MGVALPRTILLVERACYPSDLVLFVHESAQRETNLGEIEQRRRMVSIKFVIVQGHCID